MPGAALLQAGGTRWFLFIDLSHPSPGTTAPPWVCSSHGNGRDMREHVETQEDIKVLA